MGVSNVFSNKFGISGLVETLITPDKLCGLFGFCFSGLSPSTSGVSENAVLSEEYFVVAKPSPTFPKQEGREDND